MKNTTNEFCSGKLLLFCFILMFCFLSGETAFAAPGDLDASFGTGGKVTIPFGNLAYRGRSMLIQKDGKIVVAGYTYNDPTTDFAIARYNPDGTADDSFGNGGVVITPVGISEDRALSAALQADGKIIVAGIVWTGLEQFGVVRYNQNGTLDASFNGTGKVVTDMINNAGYDSAYAVKVQSDGKIIVGGTCSNKICLARYNSDGSLDSSFEGDGKLIIATLNMTDQEAAAALTLQNDGKILIAGNIRFHNGDIDSLTIRINQNGILDTTFGSGGRVITPISVAVDYATAIVIQSDGKIVIAGNSYRIGSPSTRPNVFTDYDAAIVRYLPDGSLDSTFDSDGKTTVRFGKDDDLFDDFVNAVSIQQNGKILLMGYSWNGSRNNFTLARLNSNGSLDTNFGTAGKIITTAGSVEDKGYAIALQKDGKILVGGESHLGNTLTFTVIRYLGDIVEVLYKNPFDYDGDGKSDISLFRPSNRVWYIQNSANNSYNIQQFGLSDDLIAPADYDGDGKTDIAVYRPSSGVWYWLNSSNNGFSAVKFGIAGDVPVPADYDGDNKADLAVFRPSSGVWYRLNSSNNQSSAVSFGLSEDKPTIGDFDGDGKSDIAVWRPSNGVWYRINSGSGSLSVQSFGLAGDQPVPADYDGDGKTDVSIFRPGDGKWYRLNSSTNSYEVVSFGLPEDNPVAADYDGDGKSDVAVFRPSTGTWYFLRSTQGFLGIQFGLNADIAAPNAFVR